MEVTYGSQPKRSRKSPPIAGFLAASGKSRRFERLRGGPGRIRSANQTVMSAPGPSLVIDIVPLGCRERRRDRARHRRLRARRERRLDRDRRPVVVRHLHRDLIITLAAQHKLPAVYFDTLLRRGRRPDVLWARPRRPVSAGGRPTSTASCKGEKPADLPVQAPTKYETGRSISKPQGTRPRRATTLLARADEVIE